MWKFDCSRDSVTLEEQGVWLCPNAVLPDIAAEVRNEILTLNGDGMLTQSGNVLSVRNADGSRGGISLPKPNVFEADIIFNGKLMERELLERSPVLASLIAEETEVRRKVNQTWPWLKLDKLEQAKVQVNSGQGGAFPFHFDLPAVKGARRLLTVLLYLNPEWKEGDGGEVELIRFPFPQISVPPRDGQLVMFASCTTLHRVHPFVGHCGRVCLNLWFEGQAETPFPPPLPSTADYDARAMKLVRILRQQPSELRAFCKVWYGNAMAESLRDAFEHSEELEAALALHFEEMKEVDSRISTETLEVLRECIPFCLPRIKEEQETSELLGLFDDL